MADTLKRLQAADEKVFSEVAGWHSPMADATLPRLSIAASYSRLWIAVSAVIAIFGGRHSRRAVLEALVAVAITSGTVNIIGKGAVQRSRPAIDVPDSRALEHPESSSFPSGHSASAAAFSGVMGRRLPLLAIPVNATAAGVAFSRIYTGVHYPGDVLVGWTVGRIIARLVTFVSDRCVVRAEQQG